MLLPNFIPARPSAILLLLFLISPPAIGETVTAPVHPDTDGGIPHSSEAIVTTSARTVPILLSIVPGAVLHGAGVFAAGDRTAARRLLLAEGVGIAAAAAGIAPLILTDASGQNLNFSTALIVTGLGLFVTSALADIYGAATRGRSSAIPPSVVSPVELRLGAAYVYDPRFNYRAFATAGADFRVGRFQATPEIWASMHTDHQLFSLITALRLFGPRPDRAAADGSFADIRMEAHYRRYADDEFSILTVAASLPLRADLARLGPSLTGTFVSLDVGWAFQFFDYGIDGARLGTDINGMLLMRFGWGVYFGRPDGSHGEIELFYDHRRDGLAGGLAADLHDPNFLGRPGITGHWVHRSGWGVRATVEVGSAAVSHIGLIRQFGRKQ